ncbi:Putative uncharacterized protein [Propionibacterium freudenreichii]|nr:Putative uncharacterized protein [Propionibacterium freudenreichii]
MASAASVDRVAVGNADGTNKWAPRLLVRAVSRSYAHHMESRTTRSTPDVGSRAAEDPKVPDTAVDGDATRALPTTLAAPTGLAAFTMLPSQDAGGVCDIDGTCH